MFSTPETSVHVRDENREKPLKNRENCLTTKPTTQVNSAFHRSGVGKRVPAIAGKAKAGIWFIPISDERVGMQVKL